MAWVTPEAFQFVLTHELKRAVRSQNFVTLLVMEPAVAGGPNAAPARDGLVRQIARLVGHEVRETDLLAETTRGRLSIVLLDADLRSSMQVVDRLLARLEHYVFASPIEIAVGAACCPTHGTDAESLRRAAETRPCRSRRAEQGNSPAGPSEDS